MISNERFLSAKKSAEADCISGAGIGTIGEKLVHRVLKYYFEPRSDYHEVLFRGYVADIKNEDGIIEIQTRSFDRMREKLSSFLEDTAVTLVYPISVETEVVWIDPCSGEELTSRKSSKKGKATDVFYELSKIFEYLQSENFSLKLAYIRCVDYRLLDGYGVDKKRRATKLQRSPTELLRIEEYKNTRDLLSLFPKSLDGIFSAKDFERALSLRGRRASYALSFCVKSGLISRIGKEKNAYLYRINKDEVLS